jgi:hypothetical protein
MSKVVPGFIEIPSPSFWSNAKLLFQYFSPEEETSKSFVEEFSFRLGNFPDDSLKSETFSSLAFNGKILMSFFISDGKKFFPILPRRYSCVLIERWAEIFQAYHKEVLSKDITYSMEIGAEVYKYIKSRVRSSTLKPLISAHTKKGPHELTFSTMFISKDRLILLYIVNPAYSKEETEEELHNIFPKLREALKLISEPPMALDLHIDRMTIKFQVNEEDALPKPELFIIVPPVAPRNTVIGFREEPPGKIIPLDQFIAIIDELDDTDTLSSFLEYLEDYESRFMTLPLNCLDKFGSFKDSYGVLIEGVKEPTFIVLDPHWGSKLRYKTLCEHWKLYPEVHYFDHPRSWNIIKETETRIRLEARGYFGSALYCTFNTSHIFITTPFMDMSFE